MSSQEHVKNIAIVGAGGNIGREIVKSLLECGTFNLTAISRAESNATIAPGVAVQKGDYNSSEFLESALKGQDVLIITLAGFLQTDVQTGLIKAAAKAGVKWILPNEWGSDGDNAELCKAVWVHGTKAKYRQQIEELGVSSWMGVVTNQWYDYSFKFGSFFIDVRKREATILDDGTNKVNTTTLPQAGRAVAKLLSLPINSSSSSSPSLSYYKNKFVYIRSFCVSQNDMLAAAQRATHTQPSDWTLKHTSTDQYMELGNQESKGGNMWGVVKVMYGALFKEGLGDKYHGKELANEKLGLEEEELEKVTERVVREMETEPPKKAF